MPTDETQSTWAGSSRSGFWASHMEKLQQTEAMLRRLRKLMCGDLGTHDLIVEVRTIRRSLESVEAEVVRSHVADCITHASRDGGHAAEEAYGEIIELLFNDPEARGR